MKNKNSKKTTKKVVKKKVQKPIDIWEDVRDDDDFSRWCSETVGLKPHPLELRFRYRDLLPPFSTHKIPENTLLATFEAEPGLKSSILEGFAELFQNFEPIEDSNSPIEYPRQDFDFSTYLQPYQPSNEPPKEDPPAYFNTTGSKAWHKPISNDFYGFHDLDLKI